MKLGLVGRFALPTVLLVSAGMLISTGISYVQSQKALARAIDQQLTQMAEMARLNTADWLAERTSDVRSWAHSDPAAAFLENGNSAAGEALSRQLDRWVQENPFYETISLADRNGRLVVSNAAARDRKAGDRIAGRDYFQTAISGDVAIGEATESRATGRPVLVIAAPVAAEGRVLGVLLAAVDLQDFSEYFVPHYRVGSGGYGFVCTHEGRVVAHPDPERVLKETLTDYAFGREMIRMDEGLITYAFNSNEKRVAFTSMETPEWILAVSADTDDIHAPVHRIGTLQITLGLGITLLAWGLIALIARSVTRPVREIITGLRDGIIGMEAAATQMASVSQSLAEGASQQAASVEETSASLEEMASMTRQNAENASQADRLMGEAGESVAGANGAMDRLTATMEEIGTAGEETSRIVKDIDEIAFQTNLLALNAAVEAARAGEAGAGFAVVAEEVRNLAIRAAEAAKNTAGLIEGTVGKLSEGNKMVAHANAVFRQLARTAEGVGTLVAEIAGASDEQAKGIDQVSRAMGEADAVVQKNAADAEESSASAGRIQQDAGRMRRLVRDLHQVVYGFRPDAAAVASAPVPPRRRALSEENHSEIGAARDGLSEEAPTESGASRKSRSAPEVTPEQWIPMDDEYRDF
jgi:methyl-accepting chemotaxis protein